jgi:tripartite-type tricarboxylate transporter receptor subunit TctC
MNSFGKIAVIAASALTAAMTPASAFPEKPVTFIVPFAAGGSTDVVARIMADHMSRTLGQQIVIETVVGAGGTIGTARVAKAAADGYTVVVGSLGPNVAAAAMYASLPYDPIRDFEPVIMSVQQPMVVITRKDLPVTTFREFVAYLKANASKLNYGSGGLGAQSHLTCAYLSELTGTTPQHVPFRGSAPSMNALIGGQIDYSCNNTTEAVPQIQAGTVKPLAVAGNRKVPVLPDVPTAEEQGLKFEAQGWQALFVPKGTPAAAIAKLNEAARAAFADSATRKKLMELGNELPPEADLTPAAMGRFLKSELDKWVPVIKAAKITAQ